jgi:hypothetical protein
MTDENRDATLKPAPTVHGPGNLPGNPMRGKAGGPVRLASPPRCPGCGTDTAADPKDPEGKRGVMCEVCQERADGRAPPPMFQIGHNVKEIRD